MGKTGQGKSETANTILEDVCFAADDSEISVTKCIWAVERMVGGRVISVVDTPGCFDTDKGDMILEEIAAAFAEHPEGYDAILIVVKYV